VTTTQPSTSSGTGGSSKPEPQQSQRRRARPRTRRGRLLAVLQTHLDEALAELTTQEKTIAELAQTLDKHRAKQIDLERRVAALEDGHQAALDALRASRQRHQKHLTRLEHSVETQKHALNDLEQILDPHEH
jgi:cell division protein FtsB